jgi:hypothetical protein
VLTIEDMSANAWRIDHSNDPFRSIAVRWQMRHGDHRDGLQMRDLLTHKACDRNVQLAFQASITVNR